MLYKPKSSCNLMVLVATRCQESAVPLSSLMWWKVQCS